MSSQSLVSQAIDRSFQDIIVEAFLSGLYTAIFFVTMFGLSRRLSRGRSTVYMMIVTVTMFCLSLTHLAAHWYFARIAYVRDNTGPEGIIMALNSQSFAGRMIGSVAFSLNILIADCLFIWRCWIIWGCKGKIVLIPSLTTLAGTVFSGLNLAYQGKLLGPNFIDTATPFIALSVMTTLFVTLFIVFRIYRVSSSLQSHGGGGILTYSGASYSGLIEILIESALLNTSALLALLILIVRRDNNYIYAQNIVAQISGLAPTLIIARISLNLARSRQTWGINTDRNSPNRVNTDLAFTASNTAGNLERNLNLSLYNDIETQTGTSDGVGDMTSAGKSDANKVPDGASE